ncbi:NUDIX domain-containing protein [Planktothricoides raciborskii]|uniref:NUDIX domain-containing protein n=1 Tax=Planktothricoides raciborskii GIHE-MW2 TaxID=2792601 RepID=A0AAU8J8F8_9CYAN
MPNNICQTIFAKQYLPNNICQAIFTKQYLPNNIYQTIFTKQYLPSNIYQAIFTKQYLPSNIYQAIFTKQYLPNTKPDRSWKPLNSMSRQPIITFYFVLVVVRYHHRFLLIQEPKYGQNWYFPHGKVDPGETLMAAAVRETLEEGGIPIALDGILRIEHTPVKDKARFRVIFLAHPLDDTAPKSIADHESLRAGWFCREEMKKLPLRAQEVCEICDYLASGGPIYPLRLLTDKGSPFGCPH